MICFFCMCIHDVCIVSFYAFIHVCTCLLMRRPSCKSVLTVRFANAVGTARSPTHSVVLGLAPLVF